jgi:hypothetical protein
MAINAVDQFKARVLALNLGEEYVYFRGFLIQAREHMTSLSRTAELAYGLHLLGAAVLTQVKNGPKDYSYRLRVVRPIRNVDFDKGRALYLESLREAA